MSRSISIAQRRANCLAMLRALGAPTSAAQLADLYLAAYRRHRASKRPPARHLLAGELATARAFYSLARAAR